MRSANNEMSLESAALTRVGSRSLRASVLRTPTTWPASESDTIVNLSADEMIGARNQRARDRQAAAAPLIERSDGVERAGTQPDALQYLERDVPLHGQPAAGNQAAQAQGIARKQARQH